MLREIKVVIVSILSAEAAWDALINRGSRPEVFYKKRFLKIFQKSQENTCAWFSFWIKLQTWGFIKKETLVHVFSCEFCDIFKNTSRSLKL